MTESHKNICPQSPSSADPTDAHLRSDCNDTVDPDEYVTREVYESDEQILKLLQIIREETKESQRSDAFSELLSRFRPLIVRLVNRSAQQAYGSAVSPTDRQELEEEACIALYHAARFYRTGTHATFGYFARVCIRNRLISFLRKQKNEEQHICLDEAIIGYDRGAQRVQPTALTVGDISEQVAAKDAFRVLFDRFLTSLTDYERRVFHLYVKGCSYKEIGTALGVSLKSVDNAVYRIRVKLKQQLQAQ